MTLFFFIIFIIKNLEKSNPSKEYGSKNIKQKWKIIMDNKGNNL